ncbi:MAG: ROK family transcriptional regulator [Lachnospiraceae bacterium]|nr:ROK family transcriptional regulator [Lachnospiraceae bacterium]MCI9283505.1 ROK family transcriptional regulator [Lachnospiraceae bacterium]
MQSGKRERKKETKRENKAQIARLISEAGVISKNEVAARLGFSMPTTLQHIKELMEEGYVVENGEQESTGGRKAKMLSIAEDAGYAAGMEITVDDILFVLVNMQRELVRKARIRVPFGKEFSYYEAMANWLQVFLEQTGVEQEKILGVGIALPGVVDQREKILRHSHVLQAENMSFKGFEELSGYSCEIESDAGAAVCVERAGNKRELVYLSLNDMVGGAIFLNQKVYGGQNNRSANFGHMKIEKNGRLCYCGGKGCLDAYCSAKVLQGEERNLETFFEKVRARDSGCRQRLEEYLESLAVAIADLRMVFDCDIMIGGKVGRYLKEFRKELDRKVMVCDRLDLDPSFLEIGKCQVEASAQGAAIRFVERFFEEM